MTYADSNAFEKTRNPSFIVQFLKSVASAIQRRRDVSRTVKELSKLNDRELSDIGIHRGMIASIAMELSNTK